LRKKRKPPTSFEVNVTCTGAGESHQLTFTGRCSGG
jgi:hypothetical protein